MTGSLPSHAEIVVIGGGIIGCSTAYHLAQLGVRDVVLLERIERLEEVLPGARPQMEDGGPDVVGPRLPSGPDGLRELLGSDWAHGVEAAVDIALLGRYYERIADHAVTIAERVGFMVTGEHPNPDADPGPAA